MEKTLSIIKPDAVRKGHIDEICKRIEDSALNILEKKKMNLTQEEAEGFYIAVSYTHLTLPTICSV